MERPIVEEHEGKCSFQKKPRALIAEARGNEESKSRELLLLAVLFGENLAG